VTGQVYVANSTGNTVSVIDGPTNTVTATVTVGDSPQAVAVNPVTGQVYVANAGDTTMSVIDGATNTVTATVTVGESPQAVAVNAVTGQVYVANINSNNVSVIDVATNTVTTVPVGSGPTAVAVNAVTGQVYVANEGSNNVSVIDGATNAVTTVTVGSGPFAVAVNAVTGKVYVANLLGGTVSVIDGATNTFAATIAVGSDPFAVAVNGVTGQVYVANGTDNTVSVIDGPTNAVTATVAAGSFSRAVAVNPVTGRVYVANGGSGNVSVIDGANNAAAATVPVGSNPVGAAVNAVTGQVYVANNGSNNVSVIDGATNTVTATVTVGNGPQAVAVNAVTGQVYVANNGDTVSVIDGATNTVTTTVLVGNGPEGVAVNAVTGQVYVANSNDNTVSVIDGANNTVAATVTVGTTPVGVAVNAVTGQVYVANANSSTVSVIDGATNKVAATVNVGSNPIRVAVNAVTGQVYVANSGSNNVSVIDGATNKVTTTVPVGNGPQGVVVNAVTGQVYVTNSVSGTVSVIDGATNTVAATVAVGLEPFGVAVNAVTGQVYVADLDSNTVSVIDGQGTQGVPIGITTQASATVPSPYTSSAATAAVPYITTSPAPSFTATATSSYTSTSAYSGITSAVNPPLTALYYWLDDGSMSSWQPVAPSSTAGSNPATFPIALSGKKPGFYMLYMFAAYGNEGTPWSSGNGTGNSPEISAVTAYPFYLSPIATTTVVQADTNPQGVNQNVTLTATVTTAATGAVATPTGTVNFFDGTTLLNTTPVSIAPVSGSNEASFQTSFSTGGAHSITAVFTTGDMNYFGSTSAVLTENIASVPTVTAVSPTSGPAAGGTAVTISGTNFTGATSVSFGGAAATNLTVISTTSITAVSPAGTGTVDIVVTTPGGSSVTSAVDSFTYVQPVSLVNSSVTVSPSTLPAGASTTITATVRDVNNNLLSGVLVSFSVTSTSGKAVLSSPSATTVNGIASVTLIDTVAEPVTINASLGNPTLGNLTPASVTFVAPAYVVTVNSDESSGNGVAANCVDPNVSPSGNTNCSLRDAVAAANALTGVTTSISFASNVGSTATPGTIAIAQATPITLAQNMTITGPGASALTISGANQFLILQVNSGTSTVSSLTLANGNAPNGGGILNFGTLTVSACVLSGNTAATEGGGIFNVGTLTVTNSTFSSNTAGFAGGGIASSGTLVVSGSTFNGNTASVEGGAIASFSDPGIQATATVSDSTFFNNTALSSGGGAILNFSSAGATASTALTVSNSTFSNNSSQAGGGAISSINGSTSSPSATLTVANSIFTNNTAPNGGGAAILSQAQGGPVTANVSTNVFFNNLDTGGGEDDCSGCTTNTNPIGGNPLLLPLGNYGGLTQTMLPQPGSAAICSGVAPTLITPTLTTDQRGVAIPNTTYTATPCYDVGAVQTAYALAFTTSPSTTVAGQPLTPNPVVTVSEDSSVYTAASANIAMSAAAGTLNGTTSVGTSTATGAAAGTATFTALNFTTPETNDTLTAALLLNSTLSLNAGSSEFNIIAATQTITFPQPVSPVTYGVAPITLVTSASSQLPVTFAVTGPATVNGSVLTITGAGTVEITASQAGDSTYAAATPVVRSLTVNQQPTVISVSASPTAVTPAQAVTLTATVAATIAGTPTGPTGAVTFLDNGVQLGAAVNVVNGTATLVVPSLPAGATASITATYSGDGNFLTSTSSNNASVVVAALDFSFTNTGASAYTAAPGAVATYSFALAPVYGSYAGPVSFSVTGLPTGATASFTPNTVAVGAGATPVVLTVQTAAAIVQSHNSGNNPFGRGIVLALLLLPFMAKRGVREKMKGRMLLLVLLMAGLTATLTGCGSTNGYLLQSPQTYTLTVTASSGTLEHNQSVTLIVQ
jgi:YVTN family beta-propeller protein/predicted outer membrane repeat protein